jgi:prophage antirepressor-like protein
LEDTRRTLAGEEGFVDSWSLPQVCTIFQGKKSEEKLNRLRKKSERKLIENSHKREKGRKLCKPFIQRRNYNRGSRDAQKNVKMNEILRTIRKEGLKMMRHRCRCRLRRRHNSTRCKDTRKKFEDNRKHKQLC